MAAVSHRHQFSTIAATATPRASTPAFVLARAATRIPGTPARRKMSDNIRDASKAAAKAKMTASASRLCMPLERSASLRGRSVFFSWAGIFRSLHALDRIVSPAWIFPRNKLCDFEHAVGADIHAWWPCDHVIDLISRPAANLAMDLTRHGQARERRPPMVRM